MIFSNDRELINIHGICTHCFKVVKITTSYSNEKMCYLEGKSDKLIQDVFPDLSEGDREFIISRICDSCFDQLTKGFSDNK